MAMKSKTEIPLAGVVVYVILGAGLFYLVNESGKKTKALNVGLGVLPITWGNQGQYTLGSRFGVEVGAKIRDMYPEGVSGDAIEIAWTVLRDEVPGKFGYPSAPYPEGGEFWQTENPDQPNYFDGKDSVLDLIAEVSTIIPQVLV